MSILYYFILLFSFCEFCFCLNFSLDYIEISEIPYNITFEGKSLEVLTESNHPTDHVAIQIIIFAAAIILLLLISFILCTVCCKQYRQRENMFFGRRSPSVSSIQELIRERLQDRPPTYYESQNSLNTAHCENPPAYNEIIANAEQSDGNSVFVISSKITTNYANNIPNLPFTDCESDTDSPPSYNSSEGVHNPVLYQILNNNLRENEDRRIENYQDILHI